MTQGAFITSINEAVSLLKELALFKERGPKTIGDHSEEFKKVSRTNKHTSLYNAAISNFDYEILLYDDSIFQFSLNNDVLRYAFIQNPSIFVSKTEFLLNLSTPNELAMLSEEELQELLDSINDWEYEQFLIEQELNLQANIIRYDKDKKGYIPLKHSYSHLHIGLNENLRIPCSKELTPLKFAIFCIKNTYYDQWAASFKDPETAQLIYNSKNQCQRLPNEFWQPKEGYELYLF